MDRNEYPFPIMPVDDDKDKVDNKINNGTKSK